MNDPKVSIITPCYNGENHLGYFLDSLLAQDYSNVEFFFVDDGSTDKTKEIFYSYIPKLEEKGWNVKYIYKENGGAASALNAALPLISGKYFIWPDSDDILYENHISEKVKFMEKYPEYCIAYAPSDVVKFDNLDEVIGIYDAIPDEKILSRLMREQDIVWTLGTIARVDALFDVIPTKKIYEGQSGQNFQIQMPLLYSYKCGHIDKHLAKRVVRKHSHFHTTNNKILYRRYNMFMTWANTIISLRYADIGEKCFLVLWSLYRNIFIVLKHYLSKIFSVKIKKKRIIITILGIKIKIRRKNT